MMQTLDAVRWPGDPGPRGRSVVESVPTQTLDKASVGEVSVVSNGSFESSKSSKSARSAHELAPPRASAPSIKTDPPTQRAQA